MFFYPFRRRLVKPLKEKRMSDLSIYASNYIYLLRLAVRADRQHADPDE